MFKKKSSLNTYCILLGCAVYCFLSFAGPSVPSASADDISINEQTIDTIQKNQALIQNQIQQMQSKLKQNEASGLKSFSAEQQLDLLNKIDFIYTQQISALKISVEIDLRIEKLQSELTRPVEAAENSTPVLFIALNKLIENKILSQEDEQTISSEISVAEARLQDARENQATCEKKTRRIKEDLSSQGNNATDPSLVTAELQCRLCAEEVKQNELILQNAKKELKLNQLKLATVDQKIAGIKPRVVFSDEQVQEQILEIDKHVRELSDMFERAQAKKKLQYNRWAKAKEELDTHLLSPEERLKIEQEVQTWEVLNDTRRLEVEVLSNRLGRLANLKKVWQDRFSVFHNSGTESLKTLLDETRNSLKSLEIEKQLQMANQSEADNKALQLQLQLELKAAKESSVDTWFIETQRTAFQNQIEHLDHDLKSIQTLQWAFKKLQSEIEERYRYRSFNERLMEVQAVVSSAWNYEVTSSGDLPITVGKIITVFFLLIAGYFVSHYLTGKAGKQIKVRFNLDEAAVSTIQTIAHYCLLVIIVLFVFNMVRIPLTLFTFIGGALAIGVGFGSQNIVNNFLSGLILMMERPVKIGDVVDVEGTQGTVERIGARSARIKTFDNLRLVVPNSTLLQNPLINWSLSDDIVRREIVVGVQYGSPVELVEKLLGQAVHEHQLVERKPEPIILFYDFGDNALIFKIYLWISMLKTGKKHQKLLQVESQIRFRIDAMFRDNNIVIAYPQRDVHLDAAKPLMIKIDKSGA